MVSMKKKKPLGKRKSQKRIRIIFRSILLVGIVLVAVLFLVLQRQPIQTQYVDWEQCEPGTVVEKNKLDLDHIDRYFTVEEISQEMAEDMQGKSYRDNPDIAIEDLRYLKVLHYNFDHEMQVGELVVNQEIAQDCREIFLELFQREYEIKSMRRIDEFYGEDGDGESADCNSINNDNTSGFNYRLVDGTNVLSSHALGYAIDINPTENPTMAGAGQGIPARKYLEWETYSNRRVQRPHMIQKGDVCYEIFTKHGFIWGGEWNGPLDFQHFEKGTEQ